MNLANLWNRAIKHSLFNRSVDRAPGAMRRAVRPFGQPRSAPPQPCPVRRDPRGCSSPFPRRASLWRRLRLRENAATRLRGARACLALLAAAALPRLAALLLVLAASLAAAENAAARSVTLVSNANQGLDTSSSTSSIRAQAFTTGAADATLSSVEIISEDPQGDNVAVSLCPVNSANHPASPCTALTAPSSFAAGTLVFRAPANTPLAANTTYSLLVTSPGRDHLVLDVTRSVAEDAGGTAGWSIANNFHHSPTTNAWTTHPMRALRITIKDASANNAPTVATEIPDRTATADAAFSYAFPADTFTDADGDTLTYTATKSDDSALPAWLSFAAATRTFSGTPQATDVETVSVKVTASDGTDSVTESVSDTFDIVVNVAGTNNAPTVAHAIPDRMAPAGTALSYAFPANTFNDTDAGNTLTYTATKSDDSELPSWLSFAPATRRFSGTPTAADAGTVSVKVTASDGTDSVSVTFDIVVSASTNTAPTAADKTVTTAQDTAYRFNETDFGFEDADNDQLASVLIESVPAAGALALNGVTVTTPQTVTGNEIVVGGGLKFAPAAGASGSPYTSFTFKVNDGTDDSVSAYTMTINVMIVSAPGAPTALTATASGQAWIELAWTAPAHVGGRAITGYRIEVSPNGSSWSDLVANTASTATSYVHMGLSTGATRHYRVSAINVVGTSDSSGSDHAATRTDEQLVSNFNYAGDADNISLVVQNVVGIFTTGSRDAKLNSIELKLSEFNNRTVAPALKLYTLNLDNNGRATLGTEVATLDTPSTSLTVNSFRTFSYQAPSGTSLTASQAYMFVLEPPSRGIVLVETTTDPSEDDVKADGWTIDGSGDGFSPFYIYPRKQIVFRVNGTTGTTTTTTAPGAPTGLTAAADGQSQIDLAWTAPANTGGSPITGYKIEVSPDGASDWTDLVANTESTATTYAHTGLTADTTRHYRVSAINDVGTSVASNIEEATTEEATTEEASTTTPVVASGPQSSPSTPPPPPPPGDVVGYLENPGAASFQSGIGLISGWTCDAEAVEIVLNGEPQEAAYGTARLDTEAMCGDSDNGFGLLFNWNLLGDGEHEVVALVDGVELDRATVMVTTLGTEFLRDVTGTCTAADFPTMDETVTLAWQQTQQNFVIVDGMPPTGENRTGRAGVGYLENPGPNSFQSGIGVLSGWACEGTEVVIELNGQPQPAAYGTERLDTEEACGDTANGFGLLFNWNLLGEGEHEVVAFVDGEELGRTTVRVTTLGVEFLRDVEGECEVEDFPMLGETVLLEWQQNSQNFVITDM